MSAVNDHSQEPAPVAKWGLSYEQRRTNRVITICGFVLAFIGILNIAGLVLSLIALIRSRRAGEKNGLALAGTIIAAVGVAFVVLLLTITVPTLVDAAQTCARLGLGVHLVGEATYTCTPTSFNVQHPW